jgi:aldehyde oxidoreductase
MTRHPSPDKPTSRRPIGGQTTRIDSLGKVTGRTQYVEDMAPDGLLHAHVVRCPHHHARLDALHVEAAAQMPGVVGVITAADIPGVNGFPDYSVDEPLLIPVGGIAKMRGAPVAFVAAETREAARAAAGRVGADYTPLPHTFDALDALGPNAEPIYPGGNLLSDFAIRHGDMEAAFDAADIVIERRYVTSFQEHAALERETALATFDEEGRLTVLGGTHEAHWQRDAIAAAVGLPAEQVRFITPPTGGSFGGKQDPWPHVAVGVMACLLKRPVRLAMSRSESFDASPKRHPYTLDYRIGATREGRLTGIHVRIVANTGAYDSDGKHIPDYAVTASGGPYRWEAVDAMARSVYTNGPKCGQFRGFGTPQSTYALECTLDELIQALDADPIAFRLENRLREGERSFLGYPVDESLGYGEVLNRLRPYYDAFREEVEAYNVDHPGGVVRRGIGVAGMWHRFGKSGNLRVEAHAELAGDGHFVVYCSAADYGQGIGTVMAQIAAETLGVPRDRVELVNADTARTPDSGIQGASRATYWVGNAVRDAAIRLEQRVVAAAAEMLECSPDALALAEDALRCDGGNPGAVTLAEVAAELDRMGASRRVAGAYDAGPLYPGERPFTYTPNLTTGAHLADVAVDVETGQVKVLRVAAVHDVGRAINPPDAEGQVQGAIMMGIGSALLEDYQPGVTSGFADYVLPMIGEMPEMFVELVEVPSYRGPFGAKGLGESPTLPVAPAIINAVSRAIGARIRTIPATPGRVRAAILSRV